MALDDINKLDPMDKLTVTTSLQTMAMLALVHSIMDFVVAQSANPSGAHEVIKQTAFALVDKSPTPIEHRARVKAELESMIPKLAKGN